MRQLTLIVLLSMIVCGLAKSALHQQKALSHRITTLWNGTEIDHDPITVDLFNHDGHLGITVSAPFFNSPVLEEPTVPATCPSRSYSTLFNYEVVEAFFLNDANEYLEVEISPYGRYLILLLNGYRNTVLQNLPLVPNGVDLDNPCLTKGDAKCDNRWTGTAIIPRHYLPANITKFNAFAIHGRSRDEVKPEAHDIVYEALYPVDPAVVENPDFHHLESFQPIALNEIGLGDVTNKSILWQQASGSGDFVLKFKVYKKSDCTDVPAEYNTVITSYKHSDKETTTFEIQVTDTSGVVPDIPESLQGPDGILASSSEETSEAVWISFSAEGEDKKVEQLRIGINPFGANRYELISNDEVVQTTTNAFDHVQCTRGENVASWNCTLDVPWTYFPKTIEYSQFIHMHTKQTGAVEGNNFIGTVCSGNPEGLDVVDWKGCPSDLRGFKTQEEVPTYSDLWQSALNPEN